MPSSMPSSIPAPSPSVSPSQSSPHTTTGPFVGSTIFGSAVASTLDRISSHVKAGQHPQSVGLPLMDIFVVLAITAAYLLAVPLAMRWMKNREPFRLKGLTLLHNTVQIVLSLYMSITIVRQAVRLNYSAWGNGLTTSPEGRGMAEALWVFYASKILEFTDTALMVLRKNFHQVSFLHVYHHSSIFVFWWAVIHYGPGGDAYFSAALNSAVHVVMYLYYLLAALGVRVWWKRFITLFQISQFVLNMAHSAYDMLVLSPSGRLDYPPFLIHTLFWYMISLVVLFVNYLIHDRSRAAAALRANPSKKTE